MQFDMSDVLSCPTKNTVETLKTLIPDPLTEHNYIQIRLFFAKQIELQMNQQELCVHYRHKHAASGFQ